MTIIVATNKTVFKKVFYKTNDPNLAVRHLVNRKTKKEFYRIYEKRNDGSKITDPVREVDHLNRCELCGIYIVTDDKVRFCCEAHCNIHLERANQDFEEKMYDQGIYVRRM